MENKKHIFAYIAGIIDGEGSLCIAKKSKGGYQPLIEVTMCDPSVPNFLKKEVGGFIFIRKRNYLNPKWQDANTWGLTGQKNIVKLLENITPYLVQKKKEAALITEFCKSRFDIMKLPRNERVFVKRHSEIYNQLKSIHSPITFKFL